MHSLRGFLHKTRDVVINLVLWIFILLIYSIPVGLGLIIKLCINFIAVKLHPELIPCTANDILVVRETPDKQKIATGGIILRIQGQIDFIKFQGLFQELFLTSETYERYKNLYCDLVKFCGYLFKRTVVSSNGNTNNGSGTKIDFQQHFVQKDLSQENCGYKEVLAKWFQSAFTEVFPLWQILYLRDEENDQSFVGIKAHHVLMDGYSFVHILDKLTGNFSPCLVKEEDNGSSREKFWKEAKLLFTLPKVAIAYLLRHFWFRDTFPKVPNLTKVEMLPASFGTADVSSIKKIRKALGVHFPSIVYSLQVGAIRRSLLERGMKEEDLSEVTLLTTSFPVRGHPRNAFTNHWSGGTIKVPLRLANPKERVLGANRSLIQMTKNDGPYLIWKYVSYINWLFPARLLYPMSFVNLSLFRYRCSISVIPQSTTQYYLLGQPVLNIYHAPVMKDCFPQAVMLGCSSSHKDQIDFSLFGHPEMYPSQEAMDRIMHVHFKEELEELWSLSCKDDLESAEAEGVQINWRE